MASPPDISICILTRSQPDLLPRCVASCFAEMERSGIRGEVIVIDNASTDGSPQNVAQKFPKVRILRNEENLGFSAANNKGIRISRGRHVLILNDDAILREGSLGMMLRTIDSDADIGAVGPKLLNSDGTLQRNFTNRRFPRLRSLVCGFLGLEAWLDKRTWTRDLFTHGRDLEVSGETDHIAAACLLARREALEAVGLFDEGFDYLFEDADLCYRLKRAGWRIIYIADAHVTHYRSASLNQLARMDKDALIFRSLTYYFEKHSHPAQVWLLSWTLAVVVTLRLPVYCVYRLWRYGLTREEWKYSVRTSLQAVRWLLLERPLAAGPRSVDVL